MIRSGARRAKGRSWATVMLGAFLAGLFFVGIALLWPEKERTDTGVPPPFSAPSLSSPANPPSGAPRSSAVSPRLAIVVDDLGYEPSRDAEWLKFPEKVTFAVIPFGPSSRRISESARARGWTVLLHAPMEPESPSPDQTEGFRFRRGMGKDEMGALLERMVGDLPGVSGASNHMGSAFTADPESMETYAYLLKARGLYVVDSLTTPRSVVAEAARKAGIRFVSRDVFLDAGTSGEEMRRQWEKAVAAARENGSAVLICHPRAESLKLLGELVPGLRKEGIQAVTMDEMIAGAERR